MRLTTFRTRRVALLGAAVLALALAGPGAASAKRTVPKGFFGVMAGSELLGDPSLIPSEVRLMARSGVESMRTVVYWDRLQPYATMADVPAAERVKFALVDGRPTNWSTLDPIVRAAAANRLPILPTVLAAPAWASDDPGGIRHPSHPADYAAFLTALIQRYGPHGTFWGLHPRVPKDAIRSWQLWNEPHFGLYWPSTKASPWPVTYTALLRAAYRAIHRADRHARVVLAGLSDFSWKELAQLYRAGARRWFDIAAVHPYSFEVGNIVKILRLDRAAMTKGGDRRKPIWITETSWPAAKGKMKLTYGFNVTARGQAKKIAALFPLLVRERRSLGLGRVYWYTWLSYDTGTATPFDYAGLRTLRRGTVRAKPALAAYRTAALRAEGRR